MPTFRGKPVKRNGGMTVPPTHMADGSLKYPDPDAVETVEHHDYTGNPYPNPSPITKKEED